MVLQRRSLSERRTFSNILTVHSLDIIFTELLTSPALQNYVLDWQQNTVQYTMQKCMSEESKRSI
jgi:hypothetical protein